MNARLATILKQKVLVFLVAPLVTLGVAGGAYTLARDTEQSKNDSVSLTTVTQSPKSPTANTENDEPPVSEPSQQTTAVAPDLKQRDEAPSSPSSPPPVTVVSFEAIELNAEGDIDCKLTYSDATTYQWHWTDVNPQGTWVTDSSGNNGRWLPSSQVTGTCDNTVVGRAKL